MKLPATRRVRAGDGASIAYRSIEARGDAPTFILAHATGFCGAVWAPVVDRLTQAAPGSGVVVVDQRSHGASETSPSPHDWWDIGRDLLAVIGDVAPAGPCVGVGHSGGGAGVVLAELTAPGSFSAMVLVEPILPPPPFVRDPDLPIAVRAAGRRRWFPSREAALRRWGQRPPFAEWEEEALEGYLACGLVDGDDPETGERGVVLACSPEDEFEWFLGGHEHGAWDRLGELEPRALVMAGTGSDTHADGYADAIAARIPRGAVQMVAGADHFVPMTHPAVVARAAVDLSR